MSLTSRLDKPISSLANQLEVDRPHLSLVLRLKRRPSIALAKRIEEATKGAIRWTEFFEEPSSSVAGKGAA